MNEEITYKKDLLKKEIKIYGKVNVCWFSLKIFILNNIYLGKIKYEQKQDKFKFILRGYPFLKTIDQDLIQTLNHLLEEYGEELK